MFQLQLVDFWNQNQPCRPYSRKMCVVCVQNLCDQSTHLQNEDEIIHRLVPVEEVVTARVPVLLVVHQLLDDIGMLQQAQQNLF